MSTATENRATEPPTGTTAAKGGGKGGVRQNYFRFPEFLEYFQFFTLPVIASRISLRTAIFMVIRRHL